MVRLPAVLSNFNPKKAFFLIFCVFYFLIFLSLLVVVFYSLFFTSFSQLLQVFIAVLTTGGRCSAPTYRPREATHAAHFATLTKDRCRPSGPLFLTEIDRGKEEGPLVSRCPRG